MSNGDMCYIARNKDELACAFVEDDGRYLNDTANTVATWIKRGWKVERMLRSVGLAEMDRAHYESIRRQAAAEATDDRR